MPTTPDIRSLVEQFANDITLATRRIALEELLAKLNGAESTPNRRGPGRPRGSTSKKRGRRGKFTPEQLEKMGTTIVGILKKTPGARSEQLSASMKLDAATLRIPLKALIAAAGVSIMTPKGTSGRQSAPAA